MQTFQKTSKYKEVFVYAVKLPLQVYDYMTHTFVQLLVCKPWEIKFYDYSGSMGESPEPPCGLLKLNSWLNPN